MNCWIARDKCGDLVMYGGKPRKDEERGVWGIDNGWYTPLPREMWSSRVTWEDDEPVEAMVVTKEYLRKLACG